jgi:hypothetical protein
MGLKYLWWVKDIQDYLNDILEDIINSTELQVTIFLTVLILFTLYYRIFKCGKLSLYHAKTQFNSYILKTCPQITTVSNYHTYFSCLLNFI